MNEYLTQEWYYRFNERLGILCGTDAPTKEQLFEAKEDADTWLRAVTQQNTPWN